MKAVAAWIWIIAGVMLGILVVAFGSTLILQQFDMTQKQLMINQFQDFYSNAKIVCIEGGIGEVHYYKIAIPENTRAIYISNASDALPPDKVSDYITKSKTAVGNYVCMQFFDENLPRCGQLTCYANFTYIGTPSLKPTLPSIIARLSGQMPLYNFLIMMNKTGYSFLIINATQTIGPQNPSTITTTARPII